MEVRITKFEEDLYRKGEKTAALDSLLSRFNRMVQASGMFRELKRREFYEKPSDKRRRKKQEMEAKCRRRERSAVRIKII